MGRRWIGIGAALAACLGLSISLLQMCASEAPLSSSPRDTPQGANAHTRERPRGGGRSKAPPPAASPTDGGALAGAVRAGGVVLGDAAVTVASRTGSGDLSFRTVVTSRGGEYRFEHLAPGRVVVFAARAGYHIPGFPWWQEDRLGAGHPDWERAWAVEDGSELGRRVVTTVHADRLQALDIELSPGRTVSGFVLSSDGLLVRGAEVTVRQRDAPVLLTTEDGAFELHGVIPGRAVTLLARCSGYTETDLSIEVPRDDDIEEVFLRLGVLMDVRGRVLWDTGEPADGVTVQLIECKTTGVRPAAEAMLWMRAVETRSTAGGAFSFSLSRTQGAVRVRALGPDGLETRSDLIVLQPHGTGTRDVELVLQPGLALVGRVVDAHTSRGVSGAEIRLGRAGFGWGQPPARATTDASGDFRIENIYRDWMSHRALSAGRLEIVVRAKDYVTSRSRAALDGEAVVVTVEPEAEISGEVTLPSGAPVEGVVVCADAVRPSCENHFDWGADQEAPGAVTDESGAFVIRGLQSGAYRLHLRPASDGTPRIRPRFTDIVLGGTTGLAVVVNPLGPGEELAPYSALSTVELGRDARSLAMDRRDVPGSLERWRELLERPLSDSARADALIEMARGALRWTGDDAAVESALRRARELSAPDSTRNARATYELVRTLQEREQYTDSLELARDLASRSRTSPLHAAWGELLAARALAALGKRDDAQQALLDLKNRLDPAGDASIGVLSGFVDHWLNELESGR